MLLQQCTDHSGEKKKQGKKGEDVTLHQTASTEFRKK